jgi:hypothetical protein
MESMSFDFFVCEELEDESRRKQDHRIAHIKMMVLGLAGLEKDHFEVAWERKPLEPNLSPLLLLGVKVSCIVF